MIKNHVDDLGLMLIIVSQFDCCGVVVVLVYKVAFQTEIFKT